MFEKIIKYFTKEAEEFDRLNKEIKELEEENDKLRSKIAGERVCSGYCSACRHGIKQETYGLSYVSYIRELNCKCKDFEKVE